MRNSMYLTTLTAIALALSVPAMAQSDVRSNLDAQSTTTAQTQVESKGLFSGLGDRMRHFFHRDRVAETSPAAGEDANGGVVVQNDSATDADATQGAGIGSDASTYSADDTVDNNETGTTSAGANADVNAGVGANVGGVGANLDANGGASLDAQGTNLPSDAGVAGSANNSVSGSASTGGTGQ